MNSKVPIITITKPKNSIRRLGRIAGRELLEKIAAA